MDSIVVQWCNMCNKVPAEGIAKVVDNNHQEIDLHLCNNCFKKLTGPMDHFSIDTGA